MRKKLTVLAFVGLALVLLASSVFARSSSKPRVISLSGTVTSINYSDKTFEVLVQMTNKPHLAKRGDMMRVLADDAKLYLWDKRTREPKDTLDEFLSKDDRVVINGLVIDEETIKARRVEEGKRGYK